MTRVGSVLLSAGKGSRLGPLTAAVPKPALPVLDIPLAGYPLAALARVAPPVVVNLSHLAGAAEARLETFGVAHGSAGVFSFLHETPDAFGSAGTLRALMDDLGDDVVVCNADLLTDLDPSGVMRTHAALGTEGTIAVRDVPRGADLAVEGPRVARFFDRHVDRNRRGMQYLGMAVFSRRALTLIPDHKPAGLTETLLVPLGERGRLGVHVHEGYSLDVGTPGRYLQASLDALEGRAPHPPVAPPGRIIEVQGGLAYLGAGAHATASALGPGAIVLEGGTLDTGARVERAIVWPGERVPDGVVVTDGIWAFGDLVPARSTKGEDRGY